MRKDYTPKQIGNFARARQRQIDAGIIPADPPTQSTFEFKITHCLFCLYRQVEDGSYNSNWKKRKNGHAWLSYDADRGVYVYDTRKRSDEWSDSLIDNILERNESDAVSQWIDFLGTDEYKENMQTACDYYAMQGGYFRGIREKFAKAGVVSSYEYDRLTKNKYASKVIAAKNADPAFAVGSLVDFRSKHEETANSDGSARLYKRSTNGVLILSNTEKVVSACVGAKRYKAVCVGDTKPFWIEERYLKKKKKIKVNKK